MFFESHPEITSLQVSHGFSVSENSELSSKWCNRNCGNFLKILDVWVNWMEDPSNLVGLMFFFCKFGMKS